MLLSHMRAHVHAVFFQGYPLDENPAVRRRHRQGRRLAARQFSSRRYRSWWHAAKSYRKRYTPATSANWRHGMRPYQVTLPFRRKDDLGVALRKCALLLPHEIFAVLYAECPKKFQQVFGSEASRRKYWSDSSSQPWSVGHPAPPDAVPMAIHGDDVLIRRGQQPISALVMSLSSPLTSDNYHTVLLMLCLPLKHITSGTLEILYEVIRWSCEALAAGRWPTHDHRGRAFTTGYRKRFAGHPLTPESLVAYVTELLADWKFAKESLQLKQFYNTKSCCHICKATTDPGMRNYANQRDGAFEFAVPRSEFSYFARFVLAPALSRLPGFRPLLMLCIDWMHCDHLGVCLWLAGNVLIIWATRRASHAGEWATRLNAALREIYLEFDAWTTTENLDHSEAGFNVGKLSMSKDGDWPELRSKAHNAYVICTFLASRAHEVSGGDRRLATALMAWDDAQRIMKTNPSPMPPAACDALLYAGECFF